MISATHALQRLADGNQRFVEGRSAPKSVSPEQLADAQSPFAIVLGCSDSRVPAELVFDQGLGDLFVIRVAGNIVAPSQVGSIEFAAQRFGVRLVVVLGHSQCGAVAAALEELERPSGGGSPNLGFIVDSILPCVRPLVGAGRGAGAGAGQDALMKDAVRANIRASAEHLRHGSAVLEELIRDSGLLVVGAEYALESGEVHFFDGVPGRG